MLHTTRRQRSFGTYTVTLFDTIQPLRRNIPQSLNVEELYQLVRPLPHFAWSSVSDICSRTVTPVYHSITSTLCDDVEQLAQLFVDLEVEHAREAYYEVCRAGPLSADSPEFPLAHAHT